ncbi:TetR/AcrR family transcriptional regulator [uncultured Shewanella sp.]|uniref:TetR/AcrR family transcriptional regulator n=1 Tax=uncultured Shewanella sp. TaxID=173975 RepID=UPI00260BBC72|nr:TetR/AcrR family transcriptional regulator [uncultured Shewanella sp.]
MGKQRQFNENNVLNQITECFWEHGYGATKVDKLAALTGLTKTSLYNAFGNKEAIFLKSLDYYLSNTYGDIIDQLDTRKSMTDNLDFLLKKIFLEIDIKQLNKGCMMTNSILELASNELILYAETTRRFQLIQNTIYAFFDEYVSNGRLATSMNTQEISEVFSVFFQGLRVKSRVEKSPEALYQPISSFIELMKSLEKNKD